MARKSIAKNISYDDKKKMYYVCMYHGKDENGKNIRETKMFSNLKERFLKLTGLRELLLSLQRKP